MTIRLLDFAFRARERRARAARVTAALAGAGIGALAAYFLDPERGADRRAALREGIERRSRWAARTLDEALRQIGSLSRTLSLPGTPGGEDPTPARSPAEASLANVEDRALQIEDLRPPKPTNGDANAPVSSRRNGVPRSQR